MHCRSVLAGGIKKSHDTLQRLLPPVPTKEAAIATAGLATRFGEPHGEPPSPEWMPSKQDTTVAVQGSGVSKPTYYAANPSLS